MKSHGQFAGAVSLHLLQKSASCFAGGLAAFLFWLVHPLLYKKEIHSMSFPIGLAFLVGFASGFDVGVIVFSLSLGIY